MADARSHCCTSILRKDDLVAWGWQPGEGREPAPGSQKQLGALAQAWIDSGAECP